MCYTQAHDADSTLAKYMHHYTGEAPVEEILIRGREVSPRYAKTRDYVYLRRALVHERILWVTTQGDLSLRLDGQRRSEEHTSELQSRFDLVCRLLLEKTKRVKLYLHDARRICPVRKR